MDGGGRGEGIKSLGSSCVSPDVRKQNSVRENWQAGSVFARSDRGVASEGWDQIDEFA